MKTFVLFGTTMSFLQYYHEAKNLLANPRQKIPVLACSYDFVTVSFGQRLLLGLYNTWLRRERSAVSRYWRHVQWWEKQKYKFTSPAVIGGRIMLGTNDLLNSNMLHNSCAPEQQEGISNSQPVHAARHPEPYQPHSITPNWGGTLSQGAQNSVPSPLSTPEKVLIPKLKHEALEISEVKGPFERNGLMHCSYFRPLWKRSSLLIRYSRCWAPLKARHFTHYSCK